MTRLQKKCLVAAVGAHFLALVVLLCSAFIPSHPKTDDVPYLEAIPSKTIDAMLNSGAAQAQPTPPTPPAAQPVQPPAPAPTPPPPTVEPTKPQPEPTPAPPKPVEPVKPPEPVEPDNPTPEPKVTKPKPQPHKIDVSLKEVTRKNVKDTDDSKAQAEAEEKAAAKAAQRAQEAREARVKAFRSAARNIKDSAASPTTVDLPVNSSAAYANYSSVVLSIYTDAWTLPSNSDSDEAIVKVSVTIARDGRVVNAHILDRSGDRNVDSSVQRTLDRVTEIAPFPDGSTDSERTYIIYFNLKAKRQMLG
jgi:TonB family protein